MNPAYRHARFRTKLPHGGLPESFCIVTACNPEGRTIPEQENGERTDAFRKQLAKLGYDHFPVTGFDAHSTNEEAGFGIVCEVEEAYAMGNEYLQEAIFHVHRGQVSLVACGKTMTQEPLQVWAAMADPSSHHPQFHFRGPFKLLKNPATAFLCSTQCPGDKILEAYDWARRQCDTGGTVISGFHTPVEKDVLAILARRGANIILASARDLPKSVPKELKPAWEEKRLMFLSPFGYGKVTRPSRESCPLRNRFVLGFALERTIPHIATGSSLARDIGAFSNQSE
jgi:Protein of unknown function (DUF3293)